MSSPINDDPYQALGVAKDADISAIRSAHRKLVLKFHPDRIKDEAERAKGRDLFEKVQQAYELLTDPVRKERYDDKVKIAELRKEAMTREPARSATYPMRPAAAPMSSPREYRDGAYYEERVPSSSYFDTKERFEEPVSRASSRKHDEYRPTSKGGEKDRKSSSTKSKWETAAGGMAFQAAFTLKKKAGEARERVREKDSKTKEREAQAAKAKGRDRDLKRERESQGRRAFVVDADDSDSDTATYVSQATVRPTKASPGPKMRPEPESRHTRERSNPRRDEDEDSYDDKYERIHSSVRDYIQQSRPNMARTSSDAHQYWDSEERGHSKRSGSDSDRRPTSSKGRRPDVELPKTRSSPSMPLHNSSPASLREMRAHLEEREPMQQRSNSSTTVPSRDREARRDLPRSQTMPTSHPARKDTAPSKSSKLKHAETQDSGYGSSSPHTPEMGGISPTRESMRDSTREQQRQQSSRIYRVEPIEDEDFSSRGHRTVLIDPEDRHRRVKSPSPERRRTDRRERSERNEKPEKPEKPERPKMTTDSRSRSSRAPSGQAPAETRPSATRHESSRYAQSSPRDNPRDSPPMSRHNSGRGKLFGEVREVEEREPAPYARRYAPETVSTSPRIDPDSVSHSPYPRRRGSQDDTDYFPGSNYRQELRQPALGSRRGSVY